VQPPLAVNSKSERKVNSLPPLEFELVIIGMLAHLSNHSTKSQVLIQHFRFFESFTIGTQLRCFFFLLQLHNEKKSESV
jgi:hypothetical protein